MRRYIPGLKCLRALEFRTEKTFEKRTDITNNSPDRDRKFSKALGHYLRYSHLGIRFLLSIGLPVAAGVWADQSFGTTVAFTLFGLVFGFATGVYSLYKELFRTGRPDRRPTDGSSRDSNVE